MSTIKKLDHAEWAAIYRDRPYSALGPDDWDRCDWYGVYPSVVTDSDGTAIITGITDCQGEDWTLCNIGPRGGVADCGNHCIDAAIRTIST